MYTIDFHSHILPCADHGSDGIETSKKQLEYLKRVGIDTVIATPHFYPNRHSVKDFISRRDRAYAELCDANVSGVRVIAGAEVLVCPFLEKMDGLRELCISGTDTLLLEMPMTDRWSENLVDTVEAIRDAGFTPVMAHIDRYTESQAVLLAGLGVTFQLNAECLCKLLKKKRCISLAKDGFVSALGTDIHGADVGAVQRYVKARKTLGEELFEDIMKKSERLAGIYEKVD